jgi:short-subunit dehydrogenase
MAPDNKMEYWRDKNVLVTGGSAGFGYHLANRFLRSGARVAIVGRDKRTLDQAVGKLEELHGREVLPLTADVTQAADVDRLFLELTEQWQRLDALVNNVGKSDRGRLLDTSSEKLHDLWVTNTLSSFLCTQAALPLLRVTSGHVITIGSLAAKTAVSFLGGYAMSKFPLAAFCQQLRYELAEDRIHVMLVCPGPMTRDDSRPRYDDLTTDIPSKARLPGAGVRLKLIDPDMLAAKVVAAAAKRLPELVVPGKARLLFAISQWSPRLGDWIVRRMT